MYRTTAWPMSPVPPGRQLLTMLASLPERADVAHSSVGEPDPLRVDHRPDLPDRASSGIM